MALRVLVVIALVALALTTVQAGPMYYKKVSGQKYEPDWVAVSSTVIPLAEYRVSVGGGGEQTNSALAEDEYRRAYLRHQQLSAAANSGKVKLKTVARDGTEVDETGAASGAAARVQEDPDTLITANKKFYERKNN